MNEQKNSRIDDCIDKFLYLTFLNYVRNNDEIYAKVDELQQPIVDIFEELFNENKSAELQDILSDCITDICHYVGTKGMEVAIGVMNGSIKQRIE